MDFFDLFKFPVPIFLSQSDRTSTLTGKILTILILLYLISTFITSDLLNKTNNQTTIQELKKPKHSTFLFGKNNFSLATGAADANNYFRSDPSIFFMTLSKCFVKKNGKENCSSFELEPCKQEDFQVNPDDFSFYALNGTLCLPDEILPINGYWDE